MSNRDGGLSGNAEESVGGRESLIRPPSFQRRPEFHRGIHRISAPDG